MKNLVLRAMRSFDESLTGPEYACNQLVVEIISDEPLTDTNELDVRIYSADYQLTGSVWTLRGNSEESIGEFGSGNRGCGKP